MIALKLLIFTLTLMTIFFSMSAITAFTINYFESRKKIKYNVIKFKNFISIYSIEPRSWSLYNNYITYYLPNVRYPHNEKFFRFNYIDLFLYKCWRISLKRYEKKQQILEDKKKSYEEYQLVLNDIQNNIQYLQKRTEEELLARLTKKEQL